MIARAFAIVALAAIFSPAPADACSPPYCDNDWRMAPACPVPANAPAVALAGYRYDFMSEGLSGFHYSVDAGLTMARADGGAFAFTQEIAEGSFLIHPRSSFEPGDYVVEWDEVCTRFSTYLPSRGHRVVPVRFVEDVPFPIKPPRIERVASGLADAKRFNSSCKNDFAGKISWAAIAIYPSSDQLPWLPLTRWETRVGGNVIASTVPGRILSERFVQPTSGWPSSLTTLSSPCSDGITTFEVQVRAKIVGADAYLESNTLTIDVDCSGPVSDAGYHGWVGYQPCLWPRAEDAGVDAGNETTDAGTVADAGMVADAGAVDSGSSNPPEPPPAPDEPAPCGCSGAPLTMLSALALLVTFRCRSAGRSRRAESQTRSHR